MMLVVAAGKLLFSFRWRLQGADQVTPVPGDSLHALYADLVYDQADAAHAALTDQPRRSG